jgi:hypothetical protein
LACTAQAVYFPRIHVPGTDCSQSLGTLFFTYREAYLALLRSTGFEQKAV